ncbi:MAG: alpha/beta hydrolase [Planctomycetota bacterium]
MRTSLDRFTTVLAASLLLIVALCQAGTVGGEDASATSETQVQVVRLWPGKPPGDQVTGKEHDSTTADGRKQAGRSVIRLKNVSVPQLHIYRPAADNLTDTAMVICPGGGYHILAWDLEGTEIAEKFVAMGITCAVLKYRAPTSQFKQPWAAPVADAQRALSTLRGIAAEKTWGIQQCGILGFSAGGHTACRAAMQHGDRTYESIDATDQQPCKADFAVLVYPWKLIDNEGKLLPSLVADETSPKMFFAHAIDDRVTCDNNLPSLSISFQG